MKTRSTRYKQNVEDDVKVIKGLTIFNTVVIILCLVCAGIGIYFLASYITSIMGQVGQFEDLFNQIP